MEQVSPARACIAASRATPAGADLPHPLFDPVFYRQRYSLPARDDTEAYRHFRSIGRAAGFDPNHLFSVSWYLAQNPDVRRHALDPLDHYLQFGAIQGRDPSPAFSTWGYWLLHVDVLAAGQNPLVHYLRYGRGEGRSAPSAALLSKNLEDSSFATRVREDASTYGASAACSRGAPGGRRGVGLTRADAGLDRGASPAAAATAHRCSVARRRAGTATSDLEAERVMARRSPWLIRSLAALFAHDLAASFHGIRLLGRLPSRVDGPLILLTNHPSWWDAELYHWLAVTLFPERRGFAPMNAAHLSRYPILERLGAFSTWPGGYSGAATFLNTAERLLREPDAVLFVASEGRYRDIRCRPLRVMPGLAHLARRVPDATFVPMAIEYAFWSARRPNVLIHFGAPIAAASLTDASTPQIAAHLSNVLADAMSTLADASQSRQPMLFTELLRGYEGFAGPRQLWRTLKKRYGPPRRIGRDAGRAPAQAGIEP